MGSIVMGGPPKPKTVVVPRQKYPEACVWQPTSNLLVLFKFFVGYSFLVSPVSEVEADKAFIAGRTKCDVQVRAFKCMGHESCEQELAVCANWLSKILAVDDDAALGAAAGVSFVK